MATPDEQPFDTAAASGGGSIPLTSRPPDGGSGGRRQRRTSLAARGEPMVWLTGGSAALAVLMIVGLFTLIGVYGFSTFWPQPLVRVAFTAGTNEDAQTLTIVGEPFREGLTGVVEDANGNGALDEGEDLNGNNELDAEVQLEQTLWRTGNKDIASGAFTWVRNDRILDKTYPKDFLYVERQEDGRAIGRLEAVAVEGRLYEGFDDAYAALNDVLPKVRGISKRIVGLKEELGGLGEERAEANQLMSDARETDDAELLAEAEEALVTVKEREERLQAERVELEAKMSNYRVFVRTEQGPISSESRTSKTFNVSAATVLGSELAEQAASVRFVNFRDDNTRPATTDDAPMQLESMQRLVAEPGATVVVPVGDGAGETRPKLQFLDAAGTPLGEPYALAPRALVLVEDGAEVDFGKRLAVEPLAMTFAQVVRAYPPNRLDLGDKIGVYFSRWWEFLTAEPRDANTEGGVYKQIIGTVLLTFIMIVFVVPIGVVAAIYLREYARQGVLVSFVRICVNNLAGVPSIVYGVFGLGFFCYGLGGWLDAGAAGAGVDPLPVGTWVLWIAVALIAAAVAIGVTSLGEPGGQGRGQRRDVPAEGLPLRRRRCLGDERGRRFLLRLCQHPVGRLWRVLPRDAHQRVEQLEGPSAALGVADAGVADAAGGHRRDGGSLGRGASKHA